MMKTTMPRRWLSLLLMLCIVFSLSPLALAVGENEEEDGDTPAPPAASATIQVNPTQNNVNLENPLDPNDTITVRASMSDNSTPEFRWVASPENVVTVGYNTSTRGTEATIRAHSPGEGTVTITTSTGQTLSLPITVSGIAIPEGKSSISILENGSYTLVEGTDFIRYGSAAGEGTITANFSSEKNYVARVSGGDTTSWNNLSITGIAEGDSRVTLTAYYNGRPLGAAAEFSVTVQSNQAPPIPGRASGSSPLRFSTILNQLAAQCNSMISGTTLVSITSLSVPTSQGTLYLNYKSADDTGSGVGSALTYYASGDVGPYIKDIVFVPNPTYSGDKAMITFTGNANNDRTFKGRIEVTIEPANTNITLTASPESPAKFTGSAFSEVCQRETGAPLSYVVFTLPPANQGILYEGYVSDTDYADKVSANKQYNQTALNTITFVPAPGFVGMVDIGYAGYSATGIRYDGELRINVTQSLDESILYLDGGTGAVTFSESDFINYCANVTGGRLDYVSFTPPGTSQGILYRSWRNGRGSQVYATDTFQAYLRNSPIDQITFVAADGFHGVVRIPFAGADRQGVPFTGTVEIHIQSDGSQDLVYECTPGGSVKLTASDFNDMSLKLTGQRLHYITLQTLPSLTDGAFYHNRTSASGMGESVSRDARYYNSSAPYIANLSFWASNTFRGSVEIPFTGQAVSGDTFTGMIVIQASDKVGGTNTIPYSVIGRELVTFNAEDFDAVSRSATNSSLNYVQFTLPSSSQGILYFDYDPASPVTISSTDNLYRTGEATISKVSFLPAYGYAGPVLIPFSGWAISGAQFQGAVQITVRDGATNTTIRYRSYGEPVTFGLAQFQNAGGNQPTTIHLDGLPSSDAGTLYYQYTCPTKYSWIAAENTDYHINSDPQVSNLTFLPKAGFEGVATIPYTAINADGTSFSGQIDITVDPRTSSYRFTDLGESTIEAITSIDFLAGRGVVDGTGDDQFSPKQAIRRGDFCLMLYRAFQFTPNGAVTSFADVPSDAYYAQAVQVLRSVGVVKGTGNNLFQPSENISRQDAALMIQRTLQAAGMTAPDGMVGLLSAYRDGGDVAGYAQGALACLIQMDLLPSSWNNLWPAYALTRADMAILLHRAITTN